MTTAEPTNANPTLARVRALLPEIRALGDAIEEARQLPPALVRELADAGVWRAWVPRELGGDELDPLTALQVVEELARADGSVGWVAMVQLQSTHAALRTLAKPGALEVFADPDTFIAGTIAPQGRAVAVDGGYRMTGRWGFASGASHARWFYGMCQMIDGDGETPRLAANGMPELRLLFLPAEQCTVHDVWRTTGLRGTASDDWEATEVFVPEHRCAAPPGGPPAFPIPLYGVGVFLSCPQGAHALGVASHAIDAVVELAAAKTARSYTTRLAEQPEVQARVAEAEALVASARSYLWETTGAVWRTLCDGGEPTLEARAWVALATNHAITSAAQAVELMYRVAGSSAIQATSPLDRCLRDMHTAAAHIGAGPRTREVAGRVRLGLAAGSPWW